MCLPNPACKIKYFAHVRAEKPEAEMVAQMPAFSLFCCKILFYIETTVEMLPHFFYTLNKIPVNTQKLDSC